MLQRKHGFTYLFITHDLDVVAYMADDVAVMKSGRIFERVSVFVKFCEIMNSASSEGK